MEFENKVTHNGIYYSRYIASWIKAGGNFKRDRETLLFGVQFKNWLRQTGCTEEEVKEIYWLATNGKLELESSAKRFLSN